MSASNTTLIFLGTLSLITVFNFLSCTKGYQKIPIDFDDISTLVKAIHPDKDYTYWEFCEGPSDSEKPIFSRGKKPVNIKFEPPLGSGIFSTTYLIMHYNYINYVYNGKPGYITTSEAFKSFLGAIDNLQEAVLLATEPEDLSVDNDNIKGGSYFINEDGYNLRLMRYNNCPETKESFYLLIDRNGNILKNSNMGVYFKSKSCIEY